jgi:hypothetical protein
MTTDLSVVSDRLRVASQGVAGCVLREAGLKRQGNERQRNGRNPQVTAANRAYPRITAGNGGKAILKVGKNRRHSALITEYSPKTGKKSPYIRHCSPLFAIVRFARRRPGAARGMFIGGRGRL